MRRLLLLPTVLLVLALPSFATSPAAVLIDQQASTANRVATTVTVTVPQNDAALSLNDKIIPGDGATRTIEIPPGTRGEQQKYTFSASWQPNTYTTMTRTRIVVIRPGEALKVDLSNEDPTDRVRVIYVPTPDDIAMEMVKLAGVTAADTVFEPGCGDARITIAAVKAGAKRGIGIDIDPERVEESRANAKSAGVADRVEIRLGDALDIQDLSSANVVFLYMGDHFNMLIRPDLWKELKVGARVVSHRFKMGDWEPDKTVTVTSAEGGDYELHLWTITEEIKRKAGRR